MLLCSLAVTCYCQSGGYPLIPLCGFMASEILDYERTGARDSYCDCRSYSSITFISLGDKARIGVSVSCHMNIQGHSFKKENTLCDTEKINNMINGICLKRRCVINSAAANIRRVAFKYVWLREPFMR